MLTSFSCRLGSVARYESVLASSRAEMMSMILTVPGFAGTGLEQFFLAAADGPVAKLPLDDLQPLLNLLLVGAGTVTAQQELADVRRHRVLAGELPHQVLADDVPFKRLGGDLGPVDQVAWLSVVSGQWSVVSLLRGPLFVGAGALAVSSLRFIASLPVSAPAHVQILACCSAASRQSRRSIREVNHGSSSRCS